MATVVVTFQFVSDAQGFTTTDGTHASWDSANGNPLGSLKQTLSGKNATDTSQKWTRTMTYVQMGVPTGATVTSITSASMQNRLFTNTTGGNSTIGTAQLVDGGTTVTLAAARSITSATAVDSGWNTQTGTNQTGMTSPSSNSVTINLNYSIATGNSTSAVVTFNMDVLTFTITYTPPAQILGGTGGGINTGLIGHWPLNEGAGTIAYDTSGCGANMAFSGSPTWTRTERFGTAINFPTTSDLLYSANLHTSDMTASDSFTLTAWIRYTATVTAFSQIVSRVLTSSPFTGYYLYLNQSGGSFGGAAIVDVLGTSVLVDCTAPCPINQWHFVALVCDRTANLLKVSANGNAFQTGSISSIGSLTNVGGGTLNDFDIGLNTATVRDVRLYKRALSQGEISQLFTLPPPVPRPVLRRVRWSLSGAQTYNVTVSETNTLADTESTTAVFAPSTSESNTLADTESVTAVFAPSTSESNTLADTESVTAVFAPSTSESNTLISTETGAWVTSSSASDSNTLISTESAVTGWGVSLSETNSATDTDTGVRVISDSVLETTNALVSSESGAMVTNLTVTESSTLISTENGIITDIAVEPASAASTQSATAVFNPSVSDPATATSTETGAVVYPVSLTEPNTATDTDAFGWNVSTSEPNTATDVTTGPATKVGSVTEPNTATDTDRFAWNATQTETNTATDTEFILGALIVVSINERLLPITSDNVKISTAIHETRTAADTSTFILQTQIAESGSANFTTTIKISTIISEGDFFGGSGTLTKDFYLPVFQAAGTLTEPNTATDAETVVRLTSAAITEPTSATDTPSGQIVNHLTISETGSANFNTTTRTSTKVSETGSAATLQGLNPFTVPERANANAVSTATNRYTATRPEAGLAVDANTVVIGTRIFELGHAVETETDGLRTPQIFTFILEEDIDANDLASRPVISATITVRQSYDPVPYHMVNWYPWSNRIARSMNNILAGKQNVSQRTITLTPNATTTELDDTRIGATSYLSISPITANAANDTPWFSGQTNGSVIINHANLATTDRTYRIVIMA